MDKQDFNRVLDQVTPSPQQKEAMLARLLESERKGTPMKKGLLSRPAGAPPVLKLV